MHRSRWIIILSLAFALRACVEPFEPLIEEEMELMVIDGILNDRDSIQTISVSRSSPYNNPEFFPVTGCVVRVVDNLGTGLVFREEEEGLYQAHADPGFILAGLAYKVTVFTPDGVEYESEYDTLTACPPVAQLVYEVETLGTTDPDISYHGIRFYLDVAGGSGDTRNYMWMYEETWEYHAYYPLQYSWDGAMLYDHSPEMEGVSVCYLSKRLNEYQVGSTALLTGNEIRKQPIYLVSNQSPRLLEKYSLLVLQHSLSVGAYDYLERLRSQSGSPGGLYETHPASSRGNIYNVDNAEEKVLGYFFASQIKEKRIMVDEKFDFWIPKFTCPLDTAWSPSAFGYEPLYYMYSGAFDSQGPPYISSSLECHNCLLRGGTNVKPEYWDIVE